MERDLESKRFKSVSQKMLGAQQKLFDLASTADKALMNSLKPLHERLSVIHELLTEQGLEVEALPPLPGPLPEGTKSVSFTGEVAGVLVRNCGQCHVNRQRGEFSARSYDSLMASGHVSPRRPDTSRLVEIVADGTMPPNGNVADADLQLLKLWIRQGAQFDGPDRAINLNELAGSRTVMNNDQPRLQPTKPTGTETVSFSLDIAPIFVESCRGCHFEADPVQANFNMNDFNRFLRGGESGNPFTPGKPDNSLIVKRLKGIDSEVMPPNRKLSEKKIELITRWIAEGGSFDNLNPAMNLAMVAAVAKSNAMPHEKLAAERGKLAAKNWKLIMSEAEAEVLDGDHFRVVGDHQPALKSTADLADRLRSRIVDELNGEANDPFVKGKVTLFLFQRRYDFGELGRMLVGRDLPNDQNDYWSYTAVDAYVAFILNRGDSLETLEAKLAQQLAAIHVASLAPDVPRWFADGVGYLTAARIYRKDPHVKSWQTAAARISSQLKQPFEFVRQKPNERDAGLAAYAYLGNWNRTTQLNKLIRGLRAGSSFEAAFSSVFKSTPEQFFTVSDNR
jgi:hypothetical protein